MVATKQKDFTILLVDDRKENLMVLEDLLQAEGRCFIKADSGRDALQMIKQNNDIGLILLDVQMPDLNGFEVARVLKADRATQNISIIFVTAISTEQQYVLKGFEEGAVDYLQKPLDLNIARAKVNVFEKLYFYQQGLKNALDEKEIINKQLERFAYIVAHDLKSPLSGIYSLLSLLKTDERLWMMKDVMEYVDIISNTTSYLSGMIASILEYARQSEEQQNVENVDVHELISEVSHLLLPANNVNIKVENDLPVIKTKKLKLLQVFQNLISNAIKYNDKANTEILIGANDKGEFYEFYVKDNGPGIEENDVQRVFKLFEVGNNRLNDGDSTGIGLNIFKMLVEEQGGEVKVDSILGEGSTFFFEWKKRI
ncbi:MAG TPA: response regulator [Flavipsychrobacter sp.]|nr:response regulator [Flavipsychrobacter sp.]